MIKEAISLSKKKINNGGYESWQELRKMQRLLPHVKQKR